MKLIVLPPFAAPVWDTHQSNFLETQFDAEISSKLAVRVLAGWLGHSQTWASLCQQFSQLPRGWRLLRGVRKRIPRQVLSTSWNLRPPELHAIVGASLVLYGPSWKSQDCYHHTIPLDLSRQSYLRPALETLHLTKRPKQPLFVIQQTLCVVPECGSAVYPPTRSPSRFLGSAMRTKLAQTVRPWKGACQTFT